MMISESDVLTCDLMSSFSPLCALDREVNITTRISQSISQPISRSVSSPSSICFTQNSEAHPGLGAGEIWHRQLFACMYFKMKDQAL